MMLNMRKKILAITGIRSEYDILFPVIDTLRRNGNFELKVVVSGAHLSDWHGQTVKQVKQDGFKIADKIDYLRMTNSKTQRVSGVGILTQALAKTVEREQPDFLLVVGDREESMAAALVGNYMDVLMAHIGGGDTVYGNADDPVRFAVSKLAHIHFVLSEQSKKVLLNIGEEKFRIFVSGDPALDRIKNVPVLSPASISEYLQWGLQDKKYIVLINHPLSSTKEKAYDQMVCVLQAVNDFAIEHQIKIVGIYPNTDPGALDILNAVEEFRDAPLIRFYKTLPREIFVNVMRHALCLAGNSSMGILEAPFYKMPVVNVGDRQRGRFQAGNVVFAGYQKRSILKALKRACFDRRYRRRIGRLPNPFGDGRAAEKIREVLRKINPQESQWHIKKNRN